VNDEVLVYIPNLTCNIKTRVLQFKQ